MLSSPVVTPLSKSLKPPLHENKIHGINIKQTSLEIMLTLQFWREGKKHWNIYIFLYDMYLFFFKNFEDFSFKMSTSFCLHTYIEIFKNGIKSNFSWQFLKFKFYMHETWFLESLFSKSICCHLLEIR